MHGSSLEAKGAPIDFYCFHGQEKQTNKKKNHVNFRMFINTEANTW